MGRERAGQHGRPFRSDHRRDRGARSLCKSPTDVGVLAGDSLWVYVDPKIPGGCRSDPTSEQDHTDDRARGVRRARKRRAMVCSGWAYADRRGRTAAAPLTVWGPTSGFDTLDPALTGGHPYVGILVWLLNDGLVDFPRTGGIDGTTLAHPRSRRVDAGRESRREDVHLHLARRHRIFRWAACDAGGLPPGDRTSSSPRSHPPGRAMGARRGIHVGSGRGGSRCHPGRECDLAGRHRDG